MEILKKILWWAIAIAIVAAALVLFFHVFLVVLAILLILALIGYIWFKLRVRKFKNNGSFVNVHYTISDEDGNVEEASYTEKL